MSTHPNVILLLALTPEGLSRKTMKDILANNDIKKEHDDLTISGTDYDYRIMESDYLEGMQISAKEGDLVFFNLVTYGYGEKIEWSKLEALKLQLEEWAKETCVKHHCEYQIFLTANYW